MERDTTSKADQGLTLNQLTADEVNHLKSLHRQIIVYGYKTTPDGGKSGSFWTASPVGRSFQNTLEELIGKDNITETTIKPAK